MTGGELTELLAQVGTEAMVEVLNRVEAGTVDLTEQDSLYATYAPKLTGEDLVARWDWDVGKVADLVRALSPHVGVRTFHPEVEGPIKIWRSMVLEKETICPEVGVI